MDEYDATQPQALPEHLGILVVDSRGFSKHSDRQQNHLAPLIPDVLERACHRANLPELWQRKSFPDGTGDGYMFGFPPELLPAVVHRYLEHLQAELGMAARSLRADRMSLRLRLSLHLGPVDLLDDPRLDSPVGSAMIGTHRLVDADPLRALLEHSDPDVTFLAAALSEPVMEAAVRSGRSGRHETEFAATEVRIDAKDYTGTAYLRVPAPSGDVLRYGLLGVQQRHRNTEPDPGATTAPEPPAIRFDTVDRGATAVGQTGDVGMLGSNNTMARDIDQSTHTSTVHGNHYQAHDMSVGDTNVGRRAGRRYRGDER
ncbi:hypothetical protein AB0I55_21230 [Actinocatenispora sera]|uniref:hypothetical protein n=1 Tax=Actinocatenispora sera TaxID=390989 RepID=UPI0033F70D8A